MGGPSLLLRLLVFYDLSAYVQSDTTQRIIQPEHWDPASTFHVKTPPTSKHDITKITIYEKRASTQLDNKLHMVI